MGGYARFVWPAYGLVGLVTVGLLVTSLRTLRVRERALAALQEEMPGRRGRSRDL
ncbi:heme exporter protein CcmD [Telmatospirillum siberiense]|nr:heme exporter protein CcmD [Telmatospirillum siberiense]